MKSEIRLFVIDVDGTLLTPEDLLTPAAIEAVDRLQRAGVQVVLVSTRPARGMARLARTLSLTTPMVGFDGGVIVRPDLQVIERRLIDSEAAREVVGLFERHGLEVWLYRDADWFVHDAGTARVRREQASVGFAPTVVASFDGLFEGVVKIVGVGDAEQLVRAEADARRWHGRVYAARTDDRSLDVTAPDANRHAVIGHLSRLLEVSRDQIATIGDRVDDVPMFLASGVSIAMGNASDEVKRQARHVTSSNATDGFATAVTNFVLPLAPKPEEAVRERRPDGHAVSLDGRPQVVVIGCGFGGLSVARGLRDSRVRLTVVDKHNYHTFQPLLYQVATAGLSATEVAYPIRSIFRRQRNTTSILAAMTKVDLDGRVVTLDDGSELAYDYLVLALGARFSYFGNDQWAPDAPGLKSLADAIDIRQRVLLALERAEREADRGTRDALLTFVVVGGGPTGVEMAGALAELTRKTLRRDFRNIDPTKARVVLVEAGPELLAAFPQGLREKALAQLHRLGVETFLSSRVESVDDEGVVAGGQRIPARTVMWAAGVEGAAEARGLGVPLDRRGRVLVDRTLSLPGRPEVFVIGDLAAVTQEDGSPVPGLAPAAMQEGRYVARVIRERIAGETTHEPFRYRDKGNLATIGRKSAVADLPGRLRLSGFLAWLMWMAVHIVYLIGFRNRIAVMLSWAWSYFTFQRGARVIVGEEAAPATTVPQDRPAGPDGRATRPPAEPPPTVELH